MQCVASRASLKVRAQARLPAKVQKFAQVAGVAISSLAVTLAAQAGPTVKMGADSGALVFDPKVVTIKSGESVTWVNNAGYPHNLVFDEDEVPAGANAEALSHEEYFNGPGETYTVTFKEAGSYSYYCEPHQGAGMKATVVVN